MEELPATINLLLICIGFFGLFLCYLMIEWKNHPACKPEDDDE